jgi:hypothetical protein
MRRFPLIRWLPLGAVLMLATLPLAGRLQAPCATAEAARTPVAVLTAPVSQPPSPFLATPALTLKLPVAELGGLVPGAGAASQHSDPSITAPRGTDEHRSRVRILQLRHDAFAADNLAARAGLLSSRTTAPPPLG